MKSPNKIVSTIFFCLTCKNGPFSEETVRDHGCPLPLEVIQNTITCTKKPWARFLDWILQDITFWLAFMGGVIINSLLIPHFHLSFSQELLESFCLGLLLVGLLKG